MFFVDREKCIACMQCIKDCPTADIILKDGKAHVKNEACIKCGHCIAICPVEAVATNDYDMNEVKPYDEASFKIEPERLLNFIKCRRSVRRFSKKAVEKKKLEAIIEAGRFTQTGTNRQDVSYIVIEEEMSKIKDMTYDVLKQKGEYILQHLSPETAHLERYARAWVKMHEAYYSDKEKYDRLFCHAPAAILVVSSDITDGCLASSNMELMTDALGLGTYFNGFFQVAVKDNPTLIKALGIPEGKQLVSCMVLGYPAVTYKRTVPRKKPEIVWH